MRTFSIKDTAGSVMVERKAANMVNVSGPDAEVSDGFHTMKELYQHRMMLFVALCNQVNRNPNSPVNHVWKSLRHSDDTPMYEGYFIMGLNTKPGEQITYHLPVKDYWDLTQGIVEVERPPIYDGHTALDVLNRIKELLCVNRGY